MESQTVDVLCAGRESAVALEVKLSDTRMTVQAFQERFCHPCGISGHSDGRLTGSMISVLEGLLPFADGHVSAVRGDRTWPLSQKWWLIIREQVWGKWKNRLPVRSARVLVFDDLARLYGTRGDFDELVHRIVGAEFSKRWKLELSP